MHGGGSNTIQNEFSGSAISCGKTVKNDQKMKSLKKSLDINLHHALINQTLPLLKMFTCVISIAIKSNLRSEICNIIMNAFNEKNIAQAQRLSLHGQQYTAVKLVKILPRGTADYLNRNTVSFRVSNNWKV